MAPRGNQPCQHLDFRLLVSKSRREHICVIVSTYGSGSFVIAAIENTLVSSAFEEWWLHAKPTQTLGWQTLRFLYLKQIYAHFSEYMLGFQIGNHSPFQALTLLSKGDSPSLCSSLLTRGVWMLGFLEDLGSRLERYSNICKIGTWAQWQHDPSMFGGNPIYPSMSTGNPTLSQANGDHHGWKKWMQISPSFYLNCTNVHCTHLPHLSLTYTYTHPIASSEKQHPLLVVKQDCWGLRMQ